MLLESKIRYIVTVVNISYVLDFCSLQFNSEFPPNKSEFLEYGATFKHVYRASA